MTPIVKHAFLAHTQYAETVNTDSFCRKRCENHYFTLKTDVLVWFEHIVQRLKHKCLCIRVHSAIHTSIMKCSSKLFL
jgi:hypothetical protein